MARSCACAAAGGTTSRSTAGRRSGATPTASLPWAHTPMSRSRTPSATPLPGHGCRRGSPSSGPGPHGDFRTIPKRPRRGRLGHERVGSGRRMFDAGQEPRRMETSCPTRWRTVVPFANSRWSARGPFGALAPWSIDDPGRISPCLVPRRVRVAAIAAETAAAVSTSRAGGTQAVAPRHEPRI